MIVGCTQRLRKGHGWACGRVRRRSGRVIALDVLVVQVRVLIAIGGGLGEPVVVCVGVQDRLLVGVEGEPGAGDRVCVGSLVEEHPVQSVVWNRE